MSLRLRPNVRAWREPAPIEISDELARAADHPLLAEMLARRGILSRAAAEAFLGRTDDAAPVASPLPGLDAAVERLQRAVAARERVLIWGDFDADGQTATAVLVLALRRLGLDPAWHIPDRAADGHGLSPNCLEIARAAGASLVVTCDCGASDLDQVAALTNGGVDVVVTDHHALPRDVAKLDGLAAGHVTPRRLPADDPRVHLCGVGVADALASALLERRGLDPSDLHDLVALGTLADVVPLIGENRRIVRRGLAALNEGRRPGIGAVRTSLGRPVDVADTYFAAWILAPRLNAFGRLAQAAPGVELLLCQDPARAAELATEAARLNTMRQRLCDDVVAEVRRRVEAELPPCERDGFPVRTQASVASIVASDPDWHVGITGLAAGRLAQAYAKPVALVTRGPDGRARMSARSAAWCDLVPIIEALGDDRRLGFTGGGHRGAAGGIFPAGSLDEIARLIDDGAAAQRPADDLTDALDIDCEVTLADATLATCQVLARLAPYGEGNREPSMLVRRLEVRGEPRSLGPTGRHLGLTLRDEQRRSIRAVWWDARLDPPPRGWIDVCARLERNDYNGSVEPRLVVLDIRPAR